MLSIEVDRDVLIKALQQSQHTGLVLSRDYTLGKDQWRETLAIEGTGLGNGRTRLTIQRDKIVASALGADAKE